MTQLREFLNEKERYDFRSKEAAKRIKEINREADGIERHEADCFACLLCGNGEEAEHDTI